MSAFISFVWWLFCALCWFNAILYDIERSSVIWTLIDFFIFPIGVIRGFILLF